MFCDCYSAEKVSVLNFFLDLDLFTVVLQINLMVEPYYLNTYIHKFTLMRPDICT